MFVIVLGLSLFANAAALGLAWRHLHAPPTPPRTGRSLEAWDVTIYDDLTARFQRLPRTKCGLLMLGDSIPSFLSLDLEDRNDQGDLLPSWAPVFKDRFYNRCVLGVTTLGLDDMIRKIPLPLARNVFIWAGINDLLMHVKIKESEAEYEKIITDIRAADPACSITLISVLPTTDGAALNSTIRAFNLRLATLAARTGSRFVDVRSAVTNSSGYLDRRLAAWDGIHPNTAGLARIEERLQAAHVGVN